MSAEAAAALGRPQAKVVLRLISESCVKARTSPYNALYYTVKEKELLKGCTKGHAHNRALRKIQKEVLKDMYVVVLHEHEKNGLIQFVEQ